MKHAMEKGPPTASCRKWHVGHGLVPQIAKQRNANEWQRHVMWWEHRDYVWYVRHGKKKFFLVGPTVFLTPPSLGGVTRGKKYPTRYQKKFSSPPPSVIPRGAVIGPAAGKSLILPECPLQWGLGEGGLPLLCDVDVCLSKGTPRSTSAGSGLCSSLQPSAYAMCIVHFASGQVPPGGAASTLSAFRYRIWRKAPWTGHSGS